VKWLIIFTMARYGSRFHRSGLGRLPAIARLLPGLESVHDERITPPAPNQVGVGPDCCAPR
jgi:hypothetical protein